VSVPDRTIPSPTQLEEQLVGFINGTLLRGSGQIDRDTRLFEEGHINSLRILDLIAAVEKGIGTKIPDRAVRLANFRTVATIVRTFHPGATKAPAHAAESPDRVFEHRRDRSRFALPLDALIARGDVGLTSAGQVSLSGAALDVMLAVDQTVQRWARELGAIERRYPSLISADVLRQAGREEGSIVIPSEAPKARSRGIAGVPTEGSDGPARDHCLAPAVCYHAYPEYEGKTVGAEPTILTALGRCYRYEDGNHVPLERLWEFNMREIIVLGTRDQVEQIRQSLVRRVSEYVAMLDVDSCIDVAADPFFTSADEGRRLMQQVGALKHELRLTVESDGRAIAAASFNHHHEHFGSRFDIKLADGSPAFSGCIAFGLERWVLALFSQFGVDEGTWGTSAREWLQDARRSLPRA
jgi:seryl-tRNA synthetase